MNPAGQRQKEELEELGEELVLEEELDVLKEELLDTQEPPFWQRDPLTVQCVSSVRQCVAVQMQTCPRPPAASTHLESAEQGCDEHGRTSRSQRAPLQPDSQIHSPGDSHQP